MLQSNIVLGHKMEFTKYLKRRERWAYFKAKDIKILIEVSKTYEY